MNVLETHRCNVCKVTKPVEEMVRQKLYDGQIRYYRCRVCHRRSQRDYHARNPNAARITALKSSHGLTVQEFDEILQAQGGVCAICGQGQLVVKAKAGGVRTQLSIDHDHRCCPRQKSCVKCRRGLLCTSCNTALGLVDDSIERLQMMIAYLRRWQ